MVRLIKTQTNSEDGCWIVRTSGKVNHIPMEFETKLGSGDNFDEQLNPVIVFDALYKYVGINEGTKYEMINAMEKLITDVVKLKLYTDNELAFNFDVINLAKKTIDFDFNGSVASFINGDFKIEVIGPSGEVYKVDYNRDDLVNALKNLHLAK